MQQRVADEGVGSAYGHTLYGYPYLRSDRFLASFRMELDTKLHRKQWYQQLWRLAYQTRQQELDNLTQAFTGEERESIEACLLRLAANDLTRPEMFDQLQRQSKVPSAYSSGYRILGLYPLTRLPVMRVISNEQATWNLAFNNPMFLKGEYRSYTPPVATTIDPFTIAQWLQEGRARSALGIPDLNPEQLDQLFRLYAPSWRLYYQSDADQIGTVVIVNDVPEVNTQRASVYLLPSYTRFKGDVLLQLNYMVWFPERVAESRFDPYSGELDGLIWRVTLTTEGKVLAYDSIHPCGCYHKVFPVADAIVVSPQVEINRVYQEQPQILHRELPLQEAGPVQIHLYSGSHYVVGLKVHKPSSDDKTLNLLSSQELHSLPGNSGNQSLYSSRGLVPQSQRTEQYFLWPMGVPSAGAMRQWGHHAISFTGNRHFDDPFLLENFFEYR
ncbi:MAG: hypothetical protein V7739_16145 [Motiliproteus sp.]